MIGTLGVLLLANDPGYVANVNPVPDQLRNPSLFISETLYTHLLKTAGAAD